MKNLILTGIILISVSCSSKQKSPLDNLFDKLESVTVEKFINEFKGINLNEKDSEIFFNEVENTIGFLLAQDNKAQLFFSSYSTHPDESLPAVIFITWHRKLNDLPLQLEEEMENRVNKYKKN